MATRTDLRRRRQVAARRHAAERVRRARRRRVAAGAVGLVGLVAGLLVVLGGPGPYRQTAAHLDWSPPHSRTVDGHVYPLVEAPASDRDLVDAKATVARYATSAWCHPVTAGLDPADPGFAGSLPAGDPLAAAINAARTYPATPSTTKGAAENLVRLPAPSAGGTDRFCTWIGAYPRVVAATGGHLDPPAGLGRPGYPAYYGQVVSEQVPVTVEYGWTTTAGHGVHAWASGDLTFTRAASGGGHLIPVGWTLRSWWSSTLPVAGPRYLPSGRHWDYAGEPLGGGLTAPAGAKT